MRTSQLLIGAILISLSVGSLENDDANANTPSTTVGFASGSLIIPTTAAFQDDCGAVSSYGLVYDVLRAEAWLGSNGHGTIHINYIVEPTKSSPNRCQPTSNSTPPSGSASWSDGCDFSVTGTGPLVAMIDNTKPDASGDSTSFSTQNSGADGQVSPGYSPKPVAAASSVSYGGAPFVIAASEASTFQKLIAGASNGGFDALDSSGNTIDFSPFRSGAGCSYGTTHHVNIHRSLTSFNAPVRRTFIVQPPRLAVLETNNAPSGANQTGGLASGILEQYLADAGLTFGGAQGCPTGGVNSGNLGICPNGGNAGQIYDSFDFYDLATNKLAIQDSGINRYNMLWAPHWELKGSGGPSPTEGSAMANISTFLDGQNGLMGECAAISNAFEGNYYSGSPETKTGLQLQTCKNVAGSCGGGTSYGVNRWGDASTNGIPSFTSLKNCSDPGIGSAVICTKYPTPDDEFVQTGEYMWNTNFGHDMGFQPVAATQSMFKPGVVPLLTAYSLGGSTFLGYLSTRSVKDNTPGKSNILYLGGHSQTGNVAGTKVALETLLLLGISSAAVVETTTETSRSTPVSYTLPSTAQVIFTGTQENVQPPVVPPTVNNSADLTNWKFPFVKGHLRATDDTSITTAGTALGSGTVEFDAGGSGEIPAPTYTGCSTNFAGNCRTMFTTTQAPSTSTGISLHPANVYITEANGSAVAPLMITGSSLGSADYNTLMDRLLQGYWNGTGFVSVLGGIDRSTVAVIGPSALANGARATMAYVGAMDGMLHAICSEVNASKGCLTLGQELWAFLPRSQLPWIRFNKSLIQGSPRVTDAFGDFSGSGTKSFRTILTFQTGSGDVTSATAAQPAIYALDITDPQNPTVVWEFTTPNPAARTTDSLGIGLSMTAGPVNLAGTTKNLVLAQTANGGTHGDVDATAGEIVYGLDMETGQSLWPLGPFIYAYPDPTRSGGALVPHTGVPGGAVGVDKQGQGFVTDVVFADLYGNLWEVDATTGTSRYLPNKPLFSFSSDFHPIGSPPALYSNGSSQFALLVSGGYADPADAPSWGAGQPQSVVAVWLNTSGSDATVSETGSATDIPFKFNLGSGEAGFSQATIVGGQLFVTTDSSDVNASGYGTTGAATGHVYSSPLSATATVVSIQGGASSIASAGTQLYTASSSTQTRLGSDAASTTGPTVDTLAIPKLSRMLWLRTQ